VVRGAPDHHAALAFFTPEAWDDTRLKAAETMRAALVGPRPQNVITPEMF
jgi:C-terminal binding protein